MERWSDGASPVHNELGNGTKDISLREPGGDARRSI